MPKKQPTPPTIGAQIRHARQHAGLTMRRLSQALDVEYSTLSAWERGRVVPTSATLQRIAAATGAEYQPAELVVWE